MVLDYALINLCSSRIILLLPAEINNAKYGYQRL